MNQMILDWDGCINVRDLGGIPIQNGTMTQRGAIVRSDTPARLTRQAGTRFTISVFARSLRFPRKGMKKKNYSSTYRSQILWSAGSPSRIFRIRSFYTSGRHLIYGARRFIIRMHSRAGRNATLLPSLQSRKHKQVEC